MAPTIDSRNLRRTGRFIHDCQAQADFEWFHEAQISLLVVGIDEWYWTAYCCVDTYFGSEEPITFYLENDLDAPTGGGRHMKEPVWNPREYFLMVLSRRMAQVVMEWSNVTSYLEQQLGPHVSLPCSVAPRYQPTSRLTNVITGRGHLQ